MHTLQDEKSEAHADELRFCAPHNERLGVKVPATQVVGGQAFCDACFRGGSALGRAPGTICATTRPRRTAVLGAEFTSRERQVIELVLDGLQSKPLAAALGISERTVKFHLSQLFVKSGTANRVELIAWALKRRAGSHEAPDLAPLRVSIERAKHDLLRVCVMIRASADAARRRIEEARDLGEELARIAASLGTAEQACESDIDRLQQHPGRPAPHFTSDKSLQGHRNLQRQSAAASGTRSSLGQVRG